jgi:hypothetical protein
LSGTVLSRSEVGHGSLCLSLYSTAPWASGPWERDSCNIGTQ